MQPKGLGEMAKSKLDDASGILESITLPTPWPEANARLLGLGVGLPVKPWIALRSSAQ